MADQLNVFEKAQFDETVSRSELHTYLPYGSTSFAHSEEIRILIQSQDLITATHDSFLLIEGKITRDAADVAKSCNLTNNFATFLFDEIRFELGGQRVDVCRLPGITSTLKGYASYSISESKMMSYAGWSPDNKEPLQVQFVENAQDLSKKFTVCVPLKHIFGLAEDYRQIIVNMRQELVLIRARNDLNCYRGDANSNITLTKIQWKVPHLMLSDASKLKLFERLNRNPTITIPFRQWEIYELPALKQAKLDIWPIKTSTQLEKPRWMIIGFQRNKKNTQVARASEFDNINITDLKLHLNSERYPYESMHLDFDKNNYALAYHNFISFRRNYYEDRDINNDSVFDYEAFKKCPIFIIDCSKQNESLKNSTVDVKLEMESEENFSAGTIAYALIIHDAIIQYNPLTGEVRRL